MTLLSNNSAYPTLAQFVGAYLNQDWDLIADTLEGVLDAYNEETSADTRTRLRDENESFLAQHAHDADATFDTMFGQEFEPTPDAASFLRWVTSRLNGG